MINNLGEWKEEKDYSTYPKEKWCDMDYMAAWIRSKDYEPKALMKNLITMIFGYYEDAEEVKEKAPYYESYYCPVCGDYVEPESRYCPNCGSVMGWEILW